MLLTYPAVLRDNRLEWGGDGPPPVPPAGVRVHVTLLDQPAAGSNGPAMAAALAALAAAGGPSIPDPVEWERQTRPDRPLPGRVE
jgi:hypothetical protein